MLTDMINEYFFGTETDKEYSKLKRFYREFAVNGLENAEVDRMNFFRNFDIYVGKYTPNLALTLCAAIGFSEGRIPYEIIPVELLRLAFSQLSKANLLHLNSEKKNLSNDYKVIECLMKHI